MKRQIAYRNKGCFESRAVPILSQDAGMKDKTALRRKRVRCLPVMNIFSKVQKMRENKDLRKKQESRCSPIMNSITQVGEVEDRPKSSMERKLRVYL